MTTILTSVGTRALRFAAVRRAALTAGAFRGHGLVLIFHRITPAAAPPGLVPSIPQPLFRRMLEALLEAGDVVPLEALLRPATDSRRPRFALTFDDDWMSHHEGALPILRSLGLTATFFLSGRALHGLGPLWFERLDSLIASAGIRAAARRVGVPAADADQLALACESDVELQQRVDRMSDAGVPRLGRAEIRALSDAGMTIGFHTLEHRVLPLLGSAVLEDALARGRAELEEAARAPTRVFAYPHGRGDPRAAERLRRAGFVAAFTGRPRPVRPGDDPYLLGRWEPGPVDLDCFVTRLGVRLNGWTRHA